ncbi:MAG: hypothetical protein JWP19_2208 [Rhodoglobus sp.]|nr:hypothetical protein [Rhodoglobus sp.]
MSKKFKVAAGISIAAILLSFGAMPAFAGDSSGIISCGSLVRVSSNSTVTVSGFFVRHTLNSTGTTWWYTAGSHNNVFSAYGGTWEALINGQTNSAGASCSGIA